MKKREDKKVVLITGGAGRIGSSLARDLANQRHKIILGDINITKLKELKKNLNTKDIEIFKDDLTKKKGIDRFIKFALKKFKKIDVAVHCLYPKSKTWGSKLENLNEKYLKEDLTNQLAGTIIFCQRITKYFNEVKKGNLILVSSIHGVQPPKFEHYKNLNMASPIEYSVIKSGIISITRYLSKYYKKRNLRINCVSPGGIKDNQLKLFTKRYKKSCNSKGLLKGNDVSKLIMFLISNDAKYIYGQNLIVDDGWSL